MEQIIFDEVCKFYNLTPEQLKQKRRFMYIVRARQVLAYLYKTKLKYSFAIIGVKLGFKSHCNARHGYLEIKKRIDVDKKLVAEIESIKLLIYKHNPDYSI